MKKISKLVTNTITLTTAAALTLGLTSCGPKITTGGDVPKEESVQQAQTEAKPEAKPADANEPMTLQIIDWSDSTKVRREEYNKKFMEENPNVKIEYTVLPADQFKTTITSSIKGGTAPDLFPIPSGLKLTTVVSENWFMPMDEYVTPEFMETFLPGALNEGITNLDGKLYVLPEAMNILNTLMFYNKTLFEEAGLDPENPPKTWSEFIAANKAITEAGKGKAFGMIESGKQVNRLEIAMRAFSSVAGSKSNDIGVISLVDGQNTYNSQGMMEAFELYATLVKDGSFHPSTVNLTAPEARALFAQNQAGFLIQGSWCIPTWRQDNPDLNFGVMPLPVPDSGAKGGQPYIGAQPWMGISSACENPEMAAKYLMGLYSDEYQTQLVSDGGFVSAIAGVNEKAMTDPAMLEYFELHKEAGRLAPDPIVGNANATLVYEEVKDISPNLGQIAQGVIAGAITDYETELNSYAQKTQEEWERVINVVAGNGVAVSKDDFEFKNWNPLEDYTAKEYEAK